MRLKRHSAFVFMVILFSILKITVYGFSTTGSIGKVVVKSNPVRVIRDGKSTEVGQFGMRLMNGDEVKTGKSGKAQIVLSDGNAIFFAPSTEAIISENYVQRALEKSKQIHIIFLGKILSRIRKSQKSNLRFKTANAVINIRGTEFVAEYENNMTTVATYKGLVNLSSAKTGLNIDIPPGKMSSISYAGEVLPLSEIAGDILEGVEFAGEKMSEKDIAGKKI
jgi:hypothetical protein